MSRAVVADKKIKGIGIAVRAGKTERENTVVLDFIDHYFCHLGIEPVKRISVCETDSFSDLVHKHQNVIEDIYEYAKSIEF